MYCIKHQHKYTDFHHISEEKVCDWLFKKFSHAPYGNIGQGSGHNIMTCIRVQTSNATKVTMRNIRNQTLDEHMGQFKNELPHGTCWQELMMVGLTKWKMDRRYCLEFEIHVPFQMEQQDPCSSHQIHVPFKWIHVPVTRSMFHFNRSMFRSSLSTDQYSMHSTISSKKHGEIFPPKFFSIFSIGLL